MAISHVNGIAAANISAFGGVSKSSISAINGVTASFGGGGSGGPDPNPKTILYTCGFECGLGSSELHVQTASGVSFDTGTVRSGSRSLRCNFSASSGQGATQPTTLLSGANSTGVVRLYIRFATLPNADTMLAYFGSGAAAVGLGYKTSDATLRAAHNSSSVQFGASGVSVTTGTWYRVDIKADQTSGARTSDVQVDGVACGQATSTQTGAGARNLTLGSSLTVTGEWFIDDLIISNTSGDYPLGAGHVHHFVPTADGTHSITGANQFERSATGTDITNATTDAYQLVDDVPLSSTSSDYVNAVAPASASDYVEVVIGPASGISAPTLGPRSLSAVVATNQGATGTGNKRVALVDNGTTNDIVNVSAFSGAGVTFNTKHYTDPPSAASAWTTATGAGNFNDLRMRFYSSDADPDMYWEAAMVEAEFSE